MNRRRPSRVYFFYSGGILEGEGEQQLPRHTPGKMPRFEQIGNLYRCRDAEMAKEGDDGGSGSLRILARPFLGSIFWECIYIFLRVVDPHAIFMEIRKKRQNGSKVGIVSLLVDTDSNALRTELNQLESFN